MNCWRTVFTQPQEILNVTTASSTINLKYCSHDCVLKNILLQSLFPCGSNLDFCFSVKCLEFFRLLTSHGKISSYAFASTLKAVHMTGQPIYPRLLSASRKFRKIMFDLETLKPFKMQDSVKGCLCCKDQCFLAVDGCFRLCRRKAAGKKKTQPLLSHFFIEPISAIHDKTREQSGSDCSQFRNTEQGRTRSRFKTLDETGTFLSNRGTSFFSHLERGIWWGLCSTRLSTVYDKHVQWREIRIRRHDSE